MRSHVPDAKDRQLVIKPIRDTADHTECFYPGCNAERVHSNMARSPDAKLLVCEEHRNENDYPFASYAHNRWKNGYAEPVHEDKGSE